MSAKVGSLWSTAATPTVRSPRGTVEPSSITCTSNAAGELPSAVLGEHAPHRLRKPRRRVERERVCRPLRRVAEQSLQRVEVCEVIDVGVRDEQRVERERVDGRREIGEHTVTAVEEHARLARLDQMPRSRPVRHPRRRRMIRGRSRACRVLALQQRQQLLARQSCKRLQGHVLRRVRSFCGEHASRAGRTPWCRRSSRRPCRARSPACACCLAHPASRSPRERSPRQRR